MVSVRKRTVDGRVYHYLEHSFREGGKVRNRERYLGKELPADLEVVKRAFWSEIYAERWFSDFDRIKAGYTAEQRAATASVREKALVTFAVRFTYNTNRIEGSTLTLRETALLLEHGVTPNARPMVDLKEAEAHRDTFREMLEDDKDLSFDLILSLHRRLFTATKRDIAGRLRDHRVAISGSEFVPPLPVEVYPLLMEFSDWYTAEKTRLHPVELASLVHLKLVTIHPFADGNGRISRLLMNLVLHRHGFPLLDIPYKSRAGYYGALERAQVRAAEPIFLQWSFRRYLIENRKYLMEGAES